MPGQDHLCHEMVVRLSRRHLRGVWRNPEPWRSLKSIWKVNKTTKVSGASPLTGHFIIRRFYVNLGLDYQSLGPHVASRIEIVAHDKPLDNSLVDDDDIPNKRLCFWLLAMPHVN
jgi:hypothetical protein